MVKTEQNPTSFYSRVIDVKCRKRNSGLKNCKSYDFVLSIKVFLNCIFLWKVWKSEIFESFV